MLVTNMKKNPGFHLWEAPLACQISIHSKKKTLKTYGDFAHATGMKVTGW